MPQTGFLAQSREELLSINSFTAIERRASPIQLGMEFFECLLHGTVQQSGNHSRPRSMVVIVARAAIAAVCGRWT
jgi:hypothetical protein